MDNPPNKQPPRTINLHLATFLDILWRSQDVSTQDLEVATALTIADPVANSYYIEWLLDAQGKPQLSTFSHQPLCKIWRKQKWLEHERKVLKDKAESEERTRKITVRREFILKLANKMQSAGHTSDREAAITMALAAVNFKLQVIIEPYGLKMPQEMIDDPEKYTHINTLL